MVAVARINASSDLSNRRKKFTDNKTKNVMYKFEKKNEQKSDKMEEEEYWNKAKNGVGKSSVRHKDWSQIKQFSKRTTVTNNFTLANLGQWNYKI